MQGANEQIVKKVSQWSGVTMHPHRFGGTEFRLDIRELGHLHGDVLLDIPFPRSVRNELVAAGLAEQHHVLPQSGWVSVHIRTQEDIERGISLLRRSYELAHDARKRTMNQTTALEAQHT